MKKNVKAEGEVVYQCNTCHFVLIRKGKDPPPSYCPNCAIHHLKGEMVRVGDNRKRGAEPHL